MTLYLDKKRYLDGTTAPTAPQSACNQRADQSFGMDSVRVGLSVVAGNLVTFASRVYVVCGTANCLCHPRREPSCMKMQQAAIARAPNWPLSTGDIRPLSCLNTLIRQRRLRLHNERADQRFGMDSCGMVNCLCHPGTVLREVATSGNRSSAELASLERRYSSTVLLIP